MKRAMQKCSAVILLTLLSSAALAAGVASYTLEIVPNDEVSDETMVVGSCDGGTQKIIYQRND
ncbi:conserved exported protein of unknown function [Pseudomonas marincola]|uniref:DUF1161 domain-containing protein n=2 Tax=Pseudomonas marincola TaxID=437900 RepID=A0A653E2P7_9PSED|nr:conserved exported protein of unknown function [Pseudomonas marincola]